MKHKLLRKQSLSLTAIVLGISLFTSAAFADLAGNLGYSNLKMAAKQTLFQDIRAIWPNQTLVSLGSISLDGQVLFRQENVSKMDAPNQVSEDKYVVWEDGKESSWHTWQDGQQNRHIRKNSDDASWYVTEDYPVHLGNSLSFLASGLENSFGVSFVSTTSNEVVVKVEGDGKEEALPEITIVENGEVLPIITSSALNSSSVAIIGGANGPTQVYVARDSHLTSSIMGEERLNDLEKVFDALIGNLANLVQEEASPEGGSHFSGTVINAQLSPLIQALGSFYGSTIMERVILDNGNVFSRARVNDISIDQITGDAWQTSEGLLNKVTVQIKLHGTDETGKLRQVQIDLGYEIIDVASTTIQLPDLTGQTVVIDQYHSRPYSVTEAILEEKDFGLYTRQVGVRTDEGWKHLRTEYLEIKGTSDELSCTYWQQASEGSSYTPIQNTFFVPNNYYEHDFVSEQVLISGVEVCLDFYLRGIEQPGILDVYINDSRDDAMYKWDYDQFFYTQWVRSFAE